MVVEVITGIVVGLPVESKLIDGLQLLTTQLGSPKEGWFRILAASTRSCRPTPSLTLKFLPSEKLIVFKPGPTRLFLPSLPNVPGAGGAKAAVLYHALIPALLRCQSPTTFGNWLPACACELLEAIVTVNGCPLWATIVAAV